MQRLRIQWRGMRGALIIFAILNSVHAHAGAFWLTDFVLPDSWALGIEPELILDEDSGLGIQAHFKKGFTDLVNGSVFVGTGDSKRRFRTGGELVFDLFPENESQPGIGFAAHGAYIRRLHPDLVSRAAGQRQGVLELTVIPYVHKSFVSGIKTRETAKKADGTATEDEAVAKSEDRALDPFVALPIGWNFADSHYQPMAQFILGVVIKTSANFHWNFELDMPIQHAQLTVSGGVAYFY